MVLIHLKTYFVKDFDRNVSGTEETFLKVKLYAAHRFFIRYNVSVEKKHSQKQQWNRREVLRAIGGGVVASGAAVAGGELINDTLRDAISVEKPKHETVALPEKVDFSWLTTEHAENLLGGTYHARDIVSYKANRNDGWAHEKNVAKLQDAPGWHGPCTIVYEVHQIAQSRENILSADIVTHESRIASPRDEILNEQPVKIVPGHEPVVRENLSVDTYGVDVGVKSESAYLRERLISVLGDAGMGFIGLEAFASALHSPTLGRTALGTYGLGGFFVSLARAYTHLNDGKHADASAALQKTREELPVLFVTLLTSLRNTIAAEKNNYLAVRQSQKIGHPAHLVTLWGADHSGLEAQTLRTSEQRMTTLRLWKPLILMLYGDPAIRYLLWTCPRYSYEENKNGELMEKFADCDSEVDTLKKLFSEDN